MMDKLHVDFSDTVKCHWSTFIIHPDHLTSKLITLLQKTAQLREFFAQPRTYTQLIVYKSVYNHYMWWMTKRKL